MNAVPRLSIGLPVYNGEKYLQESLDSILGQTYEDFEIIISDNASTDSTPDICQRYLRADSRIRYMRQKQNIGAAPNHNFLFQQARGELFKWVSSDDLYARDLLQRCVEVLDEYPGVVLAHSWTAAIDDSGYITQALRYPLSTDSPRPPERFWSLLFGCSGVNGTSKDMTRRDSSGLIGADDMYGVIRTKVMRQVAPHNSYWHADRMIPLELALRGPFYQVPDWLYFRRDHAGRGTHSPSMHAWAVWLDPRRASRLRHPAPRLFGEYLLGYMSAIRHAPISAHDRHECYRYLFQWLSDRAASRVIQRELTVVMDAQQAASCRSPISVDAVVAGRGSASQ